jgi:hypothetical protein
MSNHTKKTRRKKSNNTNMIEKEKDEAEEITLTSLYHMVKQGFNRIENRITLIENDIKGIHKYIKLESKFQELRNRNFIVKAYLHNHNQHSVVILPTTKFFHPSGREITDLDGFLLIRSYPNDVKQPSQELISRLPQPDFIESLQPNSVELNPSHKQHEYIIIESKHSLSKGKVDKKIAQILEIKDVFQSMPIKETPMYKTIISKLQTAAGQSNLNYPINLIFSSDDISNELVQYIESINDGSISDNYDDLTTELFYSDEYIQSIIDSITTDSDIPKQLKYILTKRSSIIDIRNLFSLQSMKEYISPYLEPYLTPYEELASTFEDMKGFVGISQFNTVNLPRLFTATSLNQKI